MGHPEADTILPASYDGSAVIQRARSRGMSDAGGPLDAWSFDKPGPLPYLAWLVQECRRELTALEPRLREHMLRARLRVRQVDEEAATAEQHIAFLESRRDQAAEQERIIRARIDEIAAAEQRRRLRREFGAPAAPEDVQPAPAEGHQTAEGRQAADDHQPAAPDPRRPTAAARWEGPYSPAPVPRWAKIAILTVLIGIDIPIQWVIFQHFHADTPLGGVLTVAVTLSVAAIMVLLPHFAGHLYRSRHVTGTERIVAPITFFLLAPALYLVGILGYLRARILLAPPTDPETGRPLTAPGGEEIHSNAEPLHAADLSIIVLFICLLFVTAGIAYVIGMARIHPLQAAYREAARATDRLEQEAEELRPRAAELQARRAREHELHDELVNSLESLRQSETDVIRETYRSAALAYIDGAVEAFADATVTEAAARLPAQDGGGLI